MANDFDDEKEATEKKRAAITDYLQSPRRKRKNFVIMAFGQSLRSDIPGSLNTYFRSQHADLALAYPKSMEDFRRHFNKLISLVIFDDEFLGLSEGLELIRLLKEHKRKTVVPVLFLTRRSDELVKSYNEILLPYHEADEYVSYGKFPVSRVLAKVQSGLVNKNRRRSRRYKVDMPVTFFQLSSDSNHAGRMLDLSVHGCQVVANDDKIFRVGDQLKLHISGGGHIPTEQGEFLRLSVRVRRVHIGGNRAGVSFEHMTDNQRLLLITFLTSIVNSQVARRGRNMKIRLSQENKG